MDDHIEFSGQDLSKIVSEEILALNFCNFLNIRFRFLLAKFIFTSFILPFASQNFIK